MKKILLVLVLLLFVRTNYAQSSANENSSDITTYYLVRHAEKDTNDRTNKNPELTREGEKRAKNFVKVLSNIKFDEVYSTDYIRTKNTAKPIAEANNLTTKIYTIRGFDLETFKKKTAGKNVFIIGHSNTIPFFANALLGKDMYKELDESEYSNLYIITLTKDSSNNILLKID